MSRRFIAPAGIALCVCLSPVSTSPRPLPHSPSRGRDARPTRRGPGSTAPRPLPHFPSRGRDARPPGSTARSICVDRFLPENHLRIPVGALEASGITRAQYDAVLDRLEAALSPEVEARGGRLDIQRLWDDPTVNAQATREGDAYVLKMFGGLARHPSITQDGFALVACHEMGHHLGGAPKARLGGWASNEGEADYYATLKCLRKVFGDLASEDFTRAQGVDPIAQKACGDSFRGGAEQALCVRDVAAGLSVVGLFQAAHHETTPPALGTPDPTVVRRTSDAHPPTQCRLDTYFQGALCPRPASDALSDDDPAPGACTASQGFQAGLRPRCWYKPPKGEEFTAAAAAPAAQPVFKDPRVAAALGGSALWNGF